MSNQPQIWRYFREVIDSTMLQEIAEADYGYGVEDHYDLQENIFGKAEN
jgi:hypothetical protein